MVYASKAPEVTQGQHLFKNPAQLICYAIQTSGFCNTRASVTREEVCDSYSHLIASRSIVILGVEAMASIQENILREYSALAVEGSLSYKFEKRPSIRQWPATTVGQSGVRYEYQSQPANSRGLANIIQPHDANWSLDFLEGLSQ